MQRRNERPDAPLSECTVVAPVLSDAKARPRRQGALLLLSLMLAATGCAKLYDHKIGSVGADYWFPELEGEFRLSAGTLQAAIDVEDDLDLGDEEFPVLHAAVQLWNVTLDASYFRAGYSGDNLLTRTITIGDQDFTIGTQVASDFDLDYGSGKAKVGLLGIGPVAAGLILGVNYFNLEASASSALGSGSESLDAPFPVVGGVVTVNQPLGDRFSVFGEAEISGLYVDAYDLRGSFFDALARAGVRFSVLKAGAGYRLMDLDLKDTDDDFEWDLELGGPFVFAELAF